MKQTDSALETDTQRLRVFLESLNSPEEPFLEELAVKAREERVPIIRDVMRSFIQVYLELLKPSRILEIGAAVGYSALLMAAHTPADCMIDTIECDQDRIRQAKENFTASIYADRIRLIEGDAALILPALEGTYDMIFMDAAKGQYLQFLPDTLRLLRCGGVMITDNVLQEGNILESHYAVERRNRTIHKRMRAYLYELKHHPLLVTTIVPIGDGAAVSVKRSIEREKNDR